MKYEGPRQAADAALEHVGTIAEADALGTINTEHPEYRVKAEEWLTTYGDLVTKFRDPEGKLSERERNALFGSAFRLIEGLPEYRDHPERATNPPERVLADLRIQVGDGLELLTDEEMERIRAYTTVGSVVDRALGVDGFLRIAPPDRYHPPAYVSFDYTINPEKNRTRADVLIRRLPDLDLAEQDYVAAVDAAGAAIVNEYRRKLLLREQRRRQRNMGTMV